MDSTMWLMLLFISAVSGCVDKSSYCGSWRKEGYCDPSSRFSSYMIDNCPQTCGLCGPPPPLDCFDKSGYCSSYKDYCTHKDYIDYLQVECKLTCNYCHITTTPPPATTTAQPYTGAAGRALQPGCGHKGPGHTRIVGGSNSKPGDWPWQANIEYEGNSGNPGNWCGGTLINDEWVLTAAHCFYEDPDKTKYWLKLGEHDLHTNSTWEKKFIIKQMILHPQYNGQNNHDYDFALLQLNKKVTFNERIRPACLPEHTTTFPTGTECYISGWGLLKEYGNGPAILQQAKVPLVDQKVCQKAFDYLSQKLSPRMFCAGYSSRAIDSCQGDSGGPLVCKRRENNEDVWYHWGAISWGVGCARKDLYGVYASTRQMSTWVSKIAFGV